MASSPAKSPKKATISPQARMDRNQMFDPDQYIEKPRPTLFNTVQKLKESKVRISLNLQKSYRRLLYVAKINDSDSKGDLESKITFLIICLEDLTNYFKQIQANANQEITGLLLLLGGFMIHLIEVLILIILRVNTKKLFLTL